MIISKDLIFYSLEFIEWVELVILLLLFLWSSPLEITV